MLINYCELTLKLKSIDKQKSGQKNPTLLILPAFHSLSCLWEYSIEIQEEMYLWHKLEVKIMQRLIVSLRKIITVSLRKIIYQSCCHGDIQVIPFWYLK